VSNKQRLGPPFNTRRLSARARAESLSSTLAGRLEGEVWIFGYASLMWRPDVAYIDRRLGIVRGYQRRLNVWTIRARGTPEHPGLGFGLERNENGSCQGVVYCLDVQAREQDLAALWEREMTTGIYRPSWLTVETGEGNVEAITFVVDEAHPQYADSLTQEQMAAAIAGAHGEWGSCHDYLRHTMRELGKLGIEEPELKTVFALVEQIDGD